MQPLLLKHEYAIPSKLSLCLIHNNNSWDIVYFSINGLSLFITFTEQAALRGYVVIYLKSIIINNAKDLIIIYHNN